MLSWSFNCRANQKLKPWTNLQSVVEHRHCDKRRDTRHRCSCKNHHWSMKWLTYWYDPKGILSNTTGASADCWQWQWECICWGDEGMSEYSNSTWGIFLHQWEWEGQCKMVGLSWLVSCVTAAETHWHMWLYVVSFAYICTTEKNSLHWNGITWV